MGILEVQAVLQRHQPELARLGVKQLLLFGSAARGEAKLESDLDFVVELQYSTLENFMTLKELLEQWFERPIDLGTLRQLKPSIRETIEKDLLRVA